MPNNAEMSKRTSRPHLIKKGDKFGKLTVIEYSHTGPHYRKFYKCDCECGNSGNWHTNALRSGNTRSCGCLHADRGVRSRLPENQGVINHIVLQYKRHAKARGLVFELDIDTFKETISAKCHYCGAPPSNVKKTKNEKQGFRYSGIDRVDPKIGYVKSNVVPCCKDCNIAKRAMTRSQFLSWITAVYKHSCQTAMAEQWG
jgi:hypothetical protein